MPWRTCKPMDEKLKFVARLLDGEKMSVVCRDFGISRPTGYKGTQETELVLRRTDGKCFQRRGVEINGKLTILQHNKLGARLFSESPDQRSIS